METIKIKDVNYPCYLTMGASLKFFRLTGSDIFSCKMDFGKTLDWLFCLTSSACARENINFPFSDTQAMADSLDPEAFNAWALAYAKSSEGKKKA